MDDSKPELPFKFLEYALIHCPYLECFQFEFITVDRQQIHIATVTDQYKARVNRRVLTKSTKENLKLVKTENYILPEEYLNLASTYLPNI